MARDTDKRATSFETENTGGMLSGFLAEEDVFDRRALWRLGAWGVASVGAVILAVYANQSSTTARRDQLAVAQQEEQIRLVAKESQSEARRLASAIETLNGDRDRLFSRVTVLEQGIETMTGVITKQQVAASPSPAPPPPASTAAAPANDPPPPAPKQPQAQSPSPAPALSPVATTVPKPTEKTMDKPAPTAAAAPEPAPATVASLSQKTSNPPASATAPAALPATTPVASPATMTTPAVTPAPPLVAAKSMMGPPDPAATKLIEPEKPVTPDKPATPEKQATIEKPTIEKSDKAEKSDKPEKPDKPAKLFTAAPIPEVVASAPPTDDAEQDAAKSLPKLPVQRTEFGVDVGGANSVGGLRALWRGLLKSRSNAALTTLRPIIVIKEASNGLGMQLRLVAGPLDDAAAAAKICAGLTENNRPCATTVFDGQRLVMNADEAAVSDKPVVSDKPSATKPPTVRYFVRRHGAPKRVAVEEPAKKPDPPPSSTLSSFFHRQNTQ